jgi:hypothetical protein
MIKVFIPLKKGRIKTNIRGFWYSEKTKRTYYDYLKIEEHFQMPSYKYLDNLRKKYNQEAIAIDDCGILKIYSNDKTEILPIKIGKKISKQNLKTEIKKALKDYGGITIYKRNKLYFAEIYFK